MIFVGLDIGGSKSVCIAATQRKLLSQIEGPGSNLHQQGIPATTRQILDLVTRSLRSEPIRVGEVHAAVCIAGLDTEKSRQSLLQALNEAEPAIVWQPENDAIAAWKGAFGCRSAGVIAIAGTGAAAYARSGGHEARAGGWGALLGDEGSGYDLGRAALIAVLREQDGMGPPTSLSPFIFSQFGIRHAHEIVDRVHFHMTPFDIAALAPGVLAEAVAGDAQARRIVDAAASALVETAAAAARAVNPDGGSTPFAVVGGLSHSDYYRERLRSFAERSPGGLAWHRPEASPVVGALHLAMESVGLNPKLLPGLPGLD